jgi:hypothetical protein
MAPNHVADLDQEVDQDRYRVGFGVRLQEFDDPAGKTVKCRLANRWPRLLRRRCRRLRRR